MCIAIVKPLGVDIPEINLRNSWIANPDGAGFCYVHKGKVRIEKGFTTLAEFLVAYKKAAEKYKRSNFLIHFRIKTHGDKSPENTHPFAIKGGALIHNGTITGTGASWNGGKSDTCLFAERISGKVTKDTIKANIKDWDSAMDYNKLAFLFDDGDYAIINEAIGQWHEGVWYSTGAYKQSHNSYSGRIYD